MKGRLALACMAVLIVSGAAVGVVAGDTIFDLDKDTPLTDSATIDQFEEEGYVSVETGVPDMTISVAESGDRVDATGFKTDVANTFIRVQYRESISRNVRFYIPKEYFYPVTKDGLKSLDGETTADLRGVEDNEYTSFTVKLDGQGEAIFAVSRQAGAVFKTINNTKTRSREWFGVEIPTIGIFGGGSDWKYVEGTHFSENQSTYAIPHEPNSTVLIQLDESGPRENEVWVPVPECSQGEVCRFQKSGVDDKTFLLVQTSDPPPVRFKEKEGPVSGTGGFWNDLKQIPGRFVDDVINLW